MNRKKSEGDAENPGIKARTSSVEQSASWPRQSLGQEVNKSFDPNPDDEAGREDTYRCNEYMTRAYRCMVIHRKHFPACSAM